MKSYPLRNFLLALLLSVPLLGAFACGESHEGDLETFDDEATVGSLELALTLPGGEDQVSAVEWEIGGPALSSPWTGVIDVTGEGKTASVFISGLPAGTGNTLTLTATTDRGRFCQGSASFAIRAGAVTRVSLVLNCQADERDQGSLGVNGEFNQCPRLGRVTVTPTEVAVGNSIELEASASDADGDELTYAWTIVAGVGNIAAPSEAAAVFICTQAGTVTLRLAVSDGSSCDGASVDVEVVCVAADLPFGIVGVAASYQPRDALNATVVGLPLGENQMYRWLSRPVGVTSTGSNVQTSTSSSYSRALSASDDDYELSVTVRQCSNASCSSGSVVAQTPWVRIAIAQDSRPVLTRTTGSNPTLPGDTFRLESSELNLATGETSQIVYRSGSGGWLSAAATGVQNFYSFTYLEPHIIDAVRLTRLNAVTLSLAVRVLRDGVAVRQSAPIVVENRNHEVQINGLQQLYMEGAVASLNAEIYPQRDGDEYVYRWEFSKVANFDAQNPSTVVWSDSATLPPSVEQVLNVADHNEGYLRVQVLKPGWTDSLWQDSVVGVSGTVRLYVTDDPDAQLFFFHNLSDHYHQGGNISLRLTVFPELSTGDQIIWEWLWPGMDWLPLPNASGALHTLVAEQALDGVQVRATLDFAAEDKESIVTGPITIHVDDHGAAARQSPTVVGETTVTEGALVTLNLAVPANGPTVLSNHRWERRAAGETEFTLIADETGPTLSFTATSADHGAEYRVSIVNPNGQVAYGPSPAVTLIVQ